MDVTTSSSTRIIDLGELRRRDEFPAYAAVYSPAAADCFALSPAAMRWSECIHLNRLDDCRQFWLNQKKKLRCKLSELFDPLLRHHYGDDYIAVFADHPWQCLLYLHYQQQHGARGLYLLHSRLDQNIYHSLSWDCWFAPQQALLEHLLALNTKGLQADSFHAMQARFRRFIHRIDVDKPQDMRAAEANSITRRFGRCLGYIWRWTFTRGKDLDGFPWIPLAPAQRPRVRRDLEYPINQWAYIEVLLREDLTDLSELMPCDECEHINRMVWDITLFNDQKISVELSFRHPYSLHRDMPEFDTALYQARYIYDDLMRKLRARDSDLDLPDSMPFSAWQVQVCERIMLAPALWDLFAAEYDQLDYQNILLLQNKLPRAFEHYQSNASFFPEQSFCSNPIGACDAQAFDIEQWSGSAFNKPLFYYSAAQPIEAPSRVQKIFLERNSSQWWLSGDALQSIRDYYILKDQRGRSRWVYRDANDDWFVQGEYC